MKKFILATLLLLAAFIVSTPVVAKPHTFGQQLSAAQCDPAGHKMVLNIVFQVTGDADSGLLGYWAIDSYTKHVQAWQIDAQTFCVQVKYSGSFVTVSGGSPGGTSTVADGITGTMEGGYNATVTGAFDPGTKRSKGNIGSKDYACFINAGVPSCQPFYHVFDEYFPGASVTQNFWGWTYDAGNNGTWVNASTGNFGDITGTP